MNGRIWWPDPGDPSRRAAGVGPGPRSPASRPGPGCPSYPSCRIRTSRPSPCSGSSRCCRPRRGSAGCPAWSFPGSTAWSCSGAEEELGSGLAADTTAAAPPTSRSAEIAPVSTIRLTPRPLACGAGVSAGTTGRRPAGPVSVEPASPAGHAIPRWSPWFGSLTWSPRSTHTHPRIGLPVDEPSDRWSRRPAERDVRCATSDSQEGPATGGGRWPPSRSRRGSGWGPGRPGACRSGRRPWRCAPTTDRRTGAAPTDCRGRRRTRPR